MSGASFLVIPQWQGSGSSRAMRLIDGAEAILGDLPVSRTHVVTVPAAADEALGTGVQRYSSLTAIRELAAAEVEVIAEPVVTVGGDGSADLASIQHAASAHPGDALALVWFDAHGDLKDVATSPSGAFHGIALRALLGDGPEGLASTGSAVLKPSSVVLAGSAHWTRASRPSWPRAASGSSNRATSMTRTPSSAPSRPPERPRCICTSTWMCSTRRWWTGSGLPNRSG